MLREHVILRQVVIVIVCIEIFTVAQSMTYIKAAPLRVVPNEKMFRAVRVHQAPWNAFEGTNLRCQWSYLRAKLQAAVSPSLAMIEKPYRLQEKKPPMACLPTTSNSMPLRRASPTSLTNGSFLLTHVLVTTFNLCHPPRSCEVLWRVRVRRYMYG